MGMRTQDLIAEAVQHVGSQSRLAELTGLSQPSIHRLATGRQRVTLERALLIEKATNGEVKASDIRPDLIGLLDGERVRHDSRPEPAQE